MSGIDNGWMGGGGSSKDIDISYLANANYTD